MSNMTQMTAEKLWNRIRAISEWDAMTQAEIGLAVGLSESMVSNIFCQMGIKKTRVRVSPKAPFVRQTLKTSAKEPKVYEPCFCGNCPLGKQSTECYSIEQAGRLPIDPSLEYLNSKSFC